MRTPLDNLDLAELHKQVQHWLGDFPADLPVVVVPIYNAFEDVLECVESLLTARRSPIPILLIDDASPDGRIKHILKIIADKENLCFVRKPKNGGFVETVNLAFEWCKPRDVIAVNSDVLLPAGWLERLREAVYCRSNIATATPFTNNGTIVSIPYRNQPIPSLPQGMTLAQIDDKIRESSARLRPIIPTAIGHCTYFKRSVLDLIGTFDEAFSPGYGEEVDFSQRAVCVGFSHVLADDLFVYHKGSRSFGTSEAKYLLQNQHEQMIKLRYPWYHDWINEVIEEKATPLAFAIEKARAALLGYSVAIDATSLNGSITGTQVVTMELIRSLALLLKEDPANQDKLTVILRDDVPLEILQGVEKLISRIVRISELEDLTEPVFDVIHRPSQLWTEQNLAVLQKAATRLIITFLDCISYANPSYASNNQSWQEFRDLAKLTFAVADGLIFISHDAAADAVHQGLIIPQERSDVIYVGVDHNIHFGQARPPQGSAAFAGQEFILVLGTNFKHKNRGYALRIYSELIKNHRWQGHLVLAGPDVLYGGSSAEEALESLHNLELQGRVHRIGAVTEGEKQWLFEHAKLVLYPSNYEGFGMIPFESAAAGTPVLTLRASSMGEVLGDKVTYLDKLDVTEAARSVLAMLTDPDLARQQVASIREKAVEYTWRQVGQETLKFYRRILQLPARATVPPLSISVLPATPQVPATASIEREYKELQAWAGQLDAQINSLLKKRGYRILARLRLI